AAGRRAGGAPVTRRKGGRTAVRRGVGAGRGRGAVVGVGGGGGPAPAGRVLRPLVWGRGRGRGGGGGGATGRQTRNGAGGYIVFALRGGTVLPVSIRTGLTDQDYIEVTSGLTDKDTVLVLPSASLVQSQQQFRQRFQNV